MDPISLAIGVGKFALGKWTWFAMAGLVLALGITSARLHHAKGDLAAARAALIDPATKRTWKVEAKERGRDLGTCHASKDALTAALDRQSAAVALAGAEGQARTAEAEKAVQAARTATQKAEAKARAILTAPSSGGDQCSRVLAVDDLFVKELK